MGGGHYVEKTAENDHLRCTTFFACGEGVVVVLVVVVVVVLVL